jgi:hypothetical protein
MKSMLLLLLEFGLSFPDVFECVFQNLSVFILIPESRSERLNFFS